MKLKYILKIKKHQTIINNTCELLGSSKLPYYHIYYEAWIYTKFEQASQYYFHHLQSKKTIIKYSTAN